MADIGVNSYGSIQGVANFVPRYANDGNTFSTETRPTVDQVISWIDQVSGILNVQLSYLGFSIPVIQADVVLALAMFVNQEVAMLSEGVNGSGRFGPSTGKGTPKGRFGLLMTDIQEFLDAYALGFERLGATRDYSSTADMGYRQYDESGDEIYPIFQRDGFGNQFDDWGGIG